MSMPPQVKGRGRPSKPLVSSSIVSIGGVSMNEFHDLLDDLTTVPEVAALPDDHQRRLTVLILEALASYRANADLRGVWYPFNDASGETIGWAKKARRGRPTQFENSPFLEDCVAAWETVTGDRIRVWYNDASEYPSVTMQIAGAALGGRGGWVGVSGFKKRARKASKMRRKNPRSQG